MILGAYEIANYAVFPCAFFARQARRPTSPRPAADVMMELGIYYTLSGEQAPESDQTTESDE